MTNYREILRLFCLGYTQHDIAASVHCSRNTIRSVIARAKETGVTWPLDDSVSNKDLYVLLYPERQKTVAGSNRKLPDFNYIHRELARPGVNMTLLWTEYCSDCAANGFTPYMYTQFCEHYRKWAQLTKATMRITHKPGDVMQVDWAGTTIKYYDSVTGEENDAYIFAAVLPCSCYAYVEACSDMKNDNWLYAHIHAFEYFGGVTRLLVSDNLKTGVIKNTRYETVLNRSYTEMADYYNTAIVPARVRKPQDKSLAEGTVKFATTWIIAALRNRKFFSIEEVNAAVAEKLENLNHMPFKKREGCRYSAYFDEEKAFMKPLPLTPYEPAVWSTAKVHLDYLITDGKNKYSVPFDLIGEQVDIRTTRDTVEVFFHGSRVAFHQRSSVTLRDPVVKPEHMPEEHRKYLTYNKEDFVIWAKGIGEHTSTIIRFFLTSQREPEQGFKACVSLIKLADKYGKARFEKACENILSVTTTPSVRTISTILKNDQRTLKHTAHDDQTIHAGKGITRGADYFRKGGDTR